MNFYSFHVGDYISRTAHLDPMEDLAYRRMIDLYWIRESELPTDPVEIAKLIRLRKEIVAINSVLSEFFDKTETGYAHKRCAHELEEAIAKRRKAKQSSELRWQNERNAIALESKNESNAPNPISHNPLPTPSKQKQSSYPNEFEEVWAAYPDRPGANKKSSFNAWNARVKSGHQPGVILEGVLRYAAYCIAMRVEPCYMKQPATFLGPDEHFLLAWEVPIARDAPNGHSRANGQSKSDKRSEFVRIMTGANNEPSLFSTPERDITGECRVVS